MINGYAVYWLYTDTTTGKLSAGHSLYGSNEMIEAMRFMELVRKDKGAQFVTMASQTMNQVGKAGSDGVESGKLPNGEDYTYTKGDALSQRTKV